MHFLHIANSDKNVKLYSLDDTQVKLAEELVISRQALIKYESGELELPVSVI